MKVVCEMRGKVLAFFGLVVLIVFLFDFAKIRKQEQTMIEQNDKIISLLEEINSKQ